MNRDNLSLIDVNNIDYQYLIGSGDFRSAECVNILKSCDVVITNPPFSIWNDFYTLIQTYNKKFAIIGTCMKVNPTTMVTSVCGNNCIRYFDTINGKTSVNCIWFTNINPVPKQPLKLHTLSQNLLHNKKLKKYLIENNLTTKDYPRLSIDNILFCPHISSIPSDYNDVMCVPLTFYEYYNPDEYEIINLNKHPSKLLLSNGKLIPRRLYIRRFNKHYVV